MQSEHRGEIMEAKLLCEFVQPRYPPQSFQASEDIIQEASASVVPKKGPKATRRRSQVHEDKYTRIRKLIFLNLFLLSVYLILQICQSFK